MTLQRQLETEHLHVQLDRGNAGVVGKEFQCAAIRAGGSAPRRAHGHPECGLARCIITIIRLVQEQVVVA